MTGKQLKAIRLKSLMTQDEFAKVLGVHWGTISEWERDIRNIGLKNQRKIVEFCKQHNIDLEELKRRPNDGK